MKISALIDSGSRTKKNVHLAQWTAQLVLGVRALRKLVDAQAAPDDGGRGLPAYREIKALPRGTEPSAGHHS